MGRSDVCAPEPNNEHQSIVFGFSFPLYQLLIRTNLAQVGTFNVSDRVRGWKKNFRIPDLAVYFDTTTAKNHDTHWVGGPDFMVEILSTGEEPYAKFDFYASVGTKEILLVDRDPWALELHRLIDGRLARIGRIKPGEVRPLTSAILPLAFSLEVPVNGRPKIRLAQTESETIWTV